MLGAILAYSVVKTTWYLEFVHTCTRVSFGDSWRLARNCIFSVVSRKWDVSFTLRPPLHHAVTSNTASPTGSLQTCQWSLPGPHPRIELTSVRLSPLRPALLYTTRLNQILHVQTDLYRHVSEDLQGPTRESNWRQYVEIFSSMPLENKIFMFCGISGSWGSEVLVSELLYKKQNLIGVFWLNAGHVKHLLTIHSEFASWKGVGGWWRESLRENRFGAPGRKTERDRSRLGLQFFLHYVLFFRYLDSPKGRACENESFFSEVTNLKLAVSEPDYCHIFLWRFKETTLKCVKSRLLFSTCENPCN